MTYSIRGDGTSNDYFPPEVPALPAFALQKAISTTIRDHARDYWTGTVYTTNRRVWEHDDDFKKYRNFVNQIDLGKRPLTSYLKAAPQFVHPRSASGWSIHSPQGMDVPSTFQQEYPNVLLAQRVISARWRSVQGR